MKVHICDLCESIIKYRTDRKIIKIKKTGFDLEVGEDFYTTRYTLCPQCFKHMIEFIENMRKVDKEIAAKDV